MSSLEVNKVFAAVLVAGIGFMGTGLLSSALIKPKEFHGTAIKIDMPQEAAAAAPAADPPIALLLASADLGRGEGLVKSQGCVACHSFNEGGKNGVGPNLYGVVGAPHAAHEGYSYSAALKGKAGPWAYDELNAWLKKPAAYAPGTKMSYAGLADPAKRADIILYLRSLAATPVALPAVPAQSAQAAVPAQPKEASAPGNIPGPPAGGAAPAVTPIAERLASADVAAGQSSMTRLGCVACHSLNEGGKNGIGPNLYGVVGQPIAAHAEGYQYSTALKKHTGENWTYEELDKWLLKPAAFAAGTKMSFAGISDGQNRANVIAYLRSLSATPEPLPAK